MTIEFNRYESSNSGATINQCDVRGYDVDEIVESLVPLIRPQSRSFYREHLRDELQRNGRSLVDVHAGCGTHYTVELTT